MNYSNNAFSVLNGGISASDTVITLATGTGARFPASNFNVTLIGYDGLGNEVSWEICLCSSRAGDVLTVARGQEGTTAAAWPGATRIEARLTAGAAAEMATKSGTETLTNKTLTTPVINGMTGGTQVVDLGSGQFYKDVSGNVGIGTSTPGALYSMDHLLAMMKNQNGTTRVTLVNNTVGANAVATFKIIGGSPNSFFDLGLADNNGAPYAVLSTGSGVQRLSFSVGGGEAARIDTSKKSTLYGDLELSGAGRRIFGDFSNATISSRVAFQTSTANGVTSLHAIPNGTSAISVIQVHNSSDADNGSRGYIQANSAQIQLAADKSGTGSYLPIGLYTSGAQSLLLDTSGNVLATRAGLGYGAGSGGTVTQATSKSTAVTLNKPSGMITLNASSISAGVTEIFQFNNSSIVGPCGLVLNLVAGSGTLQSYNVWASVGNGYAIIYFKNISAGALAEAVGLYFEVIKGATS